MFESESSSRNIFQYSLDKTIEYIKGSKIIVPRLIDKLRVGCGCIGCLGAGCSVAIPITLFGTGLIVQDIGLIKMGIVPIGLTVGFVVGVGGMLIYITSPIKPLTDDGYGFRRTSPPQLPKEAVPQVYHDAFKDSEELF